MARRLLIAGAFAILAGLGGAGTAGASLTSKPNDTTLRFQGDPGFSSLLKITSDATTVVFDQFEHPSWDPDVRAQAPCTLVGDAVSCPIAGITRIEVFFAEKFDVMQDPGVGATPIPLVVDGGGGDDTLYGGSGNDDLRGGDGGDGFFGLGGGDTFSGGAGFDRATYFGATAVRVDIDDQADDGTGNGAEGDNVRTDVEDLSSGSGNDTLIGDGDGNVLASGAGNDTVDGAGGIDIFEVGEGDDTVQARDGLGERILCSSGDDTVTADDIDELGQCETAFLSGELVRDIDRDTFAKPADCNDADPAINPAATDVPDNGRDENCDGADATIPDRDGDGVPRQFDCDDANPAIRPGANEIFGNRVDENCNGRNDPLLSLRAPVRTRFIPAGAWTRITRLQAANLKAGTRVEVVCRGRGCPFRRRAVDLTTDRKTFDVRKQLKLRRLRAGARLELRLLRADSIGQVTRWKFARRAVPALTRLCMRPSDDAPRGC